MWHVAACGIWPYSIMALQYVRPYATYALKEALFLFLQGEELLLVPLSGHMTHMRLMRHKTCAIRSHMRWCCVACYSVTQSYEDVSAYW